MTNKKKGKQINKHVLKSIYILVIFALIVSGAFFFGRKVTESTMLGIAVAIVLAVLLISLFIVGIILRRKGKQTHYLKIVILILVIGFICINGVFLITSYFIPHQTTSIFNRYYPYSLIQPYYLERYIEGKAVLVDESNCFLNQEDYTAIDHVNVAAFFSSAESVGVLEESFGKLTQEQVDLLLTDNADFNILDNSYNRGEVMFFDQWSQMDSFDTIVYLEDLNNNFYFMPYDTFEWLKQSEDE